MARSNPNRRSPSAFRTRLRLESLEDRCLLSGVFEVFGNFEQQHSSEVFGRIIAGPDGNVWFTAASVYHGIGYSPELSIYNISPAGALTSFNVHSIDDPLGITLGPDANLWFTQDHSNRIGQITPTGVVTAYKVPTQSDNYDHSSEPTGITTGPDGNLWFTENAANQIGRLTPAGVFTEFSGISPSANLQWIVAGADGNLWFTEQGVNQIGRITPSGVVTEFGIPTPNSNPVDLVTGPDRNVWFTEGMGDKIGRITPSGAITEFSLPRRGNNIGGITVGPDGNLWFTETVTRQIGRITQAGVITEFSAPQALTPIWITAGPDGNLWFTTSRFAYTSVEQIEELVLQPNVITGPDVGGGPDVRIFDSVSGALLHEFEAYNLSFTGGVRVATGDVIGNGLEEIVTAPGPGGGPDIRVFDASSGVLLREFMAYDPSFTGGVFVAVADLNGDGKAEIITAAGAGGGPDVRVFDGASGRMTQEFLAYAPGFTGGVHIAVADVNGDGTPDIITAPGAGGGPDVRVFDARSKALLQEVIAYNPSFLGGVTVAAGDVDGNGRADIITAPGAGGGPDVRVFAGGSGVLLGERMVYDPAFTGGVRVGVAAVGLDGAPEIVTAPGASGGPDVRAFVGAALTPASEFLAYSAGFTGGVQIAGLQSIAGGFPMTTATFHEFVTPTVTSAPFGIAAGPDGNLWFTENKANQIGRLTPAGVFTEFPIPTFYSNPEYITAGPDGNLWFTENMANQIGRITPDGTITEFPLPTAKSGVAGITTGPDGNLWFTETVAEQIGRITPTGTVTEFAISLVGYIGPGITTGPDGNLWFSGPSSYSNGAHSFISQITPQGVIQSFSVAPAASGGAITTGPDGNLWFTGGKIWRYTPGGKAVPFTIPTSSSSASSIIPGPDGNLWFTEQNGNSITRVTPDGRMTEFALPFFGSQPTSIVLGPNGNFWFTEQGRDQIGELVLPVNVPVSPPLIVTGADAGGGPDVRVYNAQTGALVREFFAYDPSFTGGVRVAVADVNHDGIPDIITAPGPGGGPDVRVWDGQNGALIQEIVAFAPDFFGGVFVAAGDMNGDGYAEIVTGADAGSTPDVHVYDGYTGALTEQFYAYGSPYLYFTGGVRVALGDPNGFGQREIITAPGPGGSPDVRVLSTPGIFIEEFQAYETSFTGGVFITAADVNGDGIDEIITTPGPGRAPEVRVFSAPTPMLLQSYLAYAPGFTGGVRVASVGDLNGDGLADIITAPAAGGGSDVRVFDGNTQALIDEFFAYSAGFTGGVFVGGH